ncbi:MAG: hypothetical protein JNJ54_32925 [Myxococcaceae bacterium]|nr:hypothetical protein [Myxococcaceae bacterium]
MSRALAGVAFLSAAVGAAADGGTAESPSRGALVRFHTACASCHVAECSGRLSFDSGSAGARGHVKRYAPTANDAVVRELFSMLTSLKRTCQHALPAPPLLPRFDAAFLAEHFNPDASAWFVPLPARSRTGVVELDVGVGQHAEVSLLDDSLETLVEVHGAGTLRLDAPASARPSFLLVRRAQSVSRLEVR